MATTLSTTHTKLSGIGIGKGLGAGVGKGVGPRAVGVLRNISSEFGTISDITATHKEKTKPHSDVPDLPEGTAKKGDDIFFYRMLAGSLCAVLLNDLHDVLFEDQIRSITSGILRSIRSVSGEHVFCPLRAVLLSDPRALLGGVHPHFVPSTTAVTELPALPSSSSSLSSSSSHTDRVLLTSNAIRRNRPYSSLVVRTAAHLMASTYVHYRNHISESHHANSPTNSQCDTESVRPFTANLEIPSPSTFPTVTSSVLFSAAIADMSSSLRLVFIFETCYVCVCVCTCTCVCMCEYASRYTHALIRKFMYICV